MKLLNEKNFSEEMKEYVEPCFDAWGRESYYSREKGREIFCLSLHRKNAGGVILISHGFCESAEKYKELAWYFYQGGFTVYIPEHCGHGRSYRLTRDPCKVHIDSFWRYVKDLSYVASRIEEENPGLPLMLFGHSMGGAIAAVTLAENPGKFHKGILNAPMILHRTGKIPPAIAYGASFLVCSLGRGEAYAPGQHGFRDDETFEASSSLSRARFDHYYEKRRSIPEFQNNGASYQWGLEAYRMTREILEDSWKKITLPVMLFQAERDTLVYNRFQEKFIGRLPKGRLVRVAGAKHEIYRCGNDILRPYLNKVLGFYLKNEQD